MNAIRFFPAALCLLLPLAAQATPGDTSIGQELAEARKEVRVELAKAKLELETGNLSLNDSLQFGKHDKPKTAASSLPKAEITPDGDFLIDGKAQAIDLDQRRQLLAYRGLVVEVAKTGIDIGQKSAEAALDAVSGSWVGLLFGAMTGSLERRVERVVKEQVEPAVRGICRTLPRVMESQQRLSASVPQFRPYATLEAADVANCESDVRREFASR